MIIVFISGTGSNLNAICNAGLSSSIACVISNTPHAKGLDIAKKYHIPTYVVDNKLYTNKADFERELIAIVDNYTPKYLILAGFMRILSGDFVNKYHHQIINIHPSLLPSFTGMHAQKQAFASRVKIIGITIHFVTDKLDCGPIILQAVTNIDRQDTEDDVTIKLLKIEYIVYPFIIRKLLNNMVDIRNDNYVIVKHEKMDKDILNNQNFYVAY